MDENKYPVLKKYLEHLNTNNKGEQNNYSLDNLNLFNNVLNLYFEKYFNNISREYAEKKVLKEEDIYISNKNIIDDFFGFYNKLERKDGKGKIIKLSNENHLINLFIADDNAIGKNKIQNGIFDNNYRSKINIQQIIEKEIFTFTLAERISFTEIVFNSSYRKVLDDVHGNYESYKEYEINYDMIEEIMTDYLLKNKKLLNYENINDIIYNNKVFSNDVTNYISLFNKNYNCKNIDNDNKISIYKFNMDNRNYTILCKDMIYEFITLIKILNEKKMKVMIMILRKNQKYMKSLIN